MIRADRNPTGITATKFMARKVWKDICAEPLLYCLMIPGIAYFIIFHYLPIYGVSIAFRDFSIVKGFDNAPFVGFKNFEKLFERSAFKAALSNNIKISVIKLAFGFPLPILLSLFISEVWSTKYRKFVQTSVILPSLVSWFVIYGILNALCNTDNGVIPMILTSINEHFGTSIPIVNYMSNKSTFYFYIWATYTWKGIGTGTIFYLAAITGIDHSLYEAATIDGAGRLRQIWHITLSSIRSTIIMLFIIRVGDVMNAGFDQMFALSNPLVLSKADIIDTYVYRIGMQEAKFSLATASGLFKSAIGLVLVLTTNAIVKKIEPENAVM